MQGNEAGNKISELLNELERHGFSFHPTDGVIYIFKTHLGKLHTLGRITEGSTTEPNGWRFVAREEYTKA